jgi:hypothetical protein
MEIRVFGTRQQLISLVSFKMNGIAGNHADEPVIR